MQRRPRAQAPTTRQDGLLSRADGDTWNCNNMTGGELMLTRIRTLLRRIPAWWQRCTRPGADPLLASEAERARARAAADYLNRVGDPGHTAGM